MGKLHALRKAIEKEPEKWMWGRRWFYPTPGSQQRAFGAARYGREWSPVRSHSRVHSYRHFVRSVLNGLGFDVK